MQPSDFTKFPAKSVLENSQAETVAQRIMQILAGTGNIFRLLSWEEYKKERTKKGDFTEYERYYYDETVDYCENEKVAYLFSPEWKKLKPAPATN